MQAALGVRREKNSRPLPQRGLFPVWIGVCQNHVQPIARGAIGRERQMSRKEVWSVWAVMVSAVLAVGSSQALFEYRGSNVVLAAETGTPTQATPISQSELKALVAPIALYPDKLVAVVLAAATFPDQVAIAEYWLQQHKSLTGSALVQAVNTQSWDASVKALTQFPSVLGNMAKSLSWT